MCKKQFVFNGETYERGEKSRYYFKKTTRNVERKNAKQLHRAVWEYYNGKIPEGHQIHHIDGDIDNNDISNLECISRKDHLSMHAQKNKENDEYVNKNRKQLAEASKRAALWHSSGEGKKWHSEHAKNSIQKTQRIEKKCAFCEKTMQALPWQEYCCQSCQEKARRRRIGLKFTGEKRVCKNCEEEFFPKAHNQLFCTPTCKSRYHRTVKKE